MEKGEDFFAKHIIGEYYQEIFEAAKKIKGKADGWTKVIKKLQTNAWLFKPELRMSSIITYEKRSCVRKPWWHSIFSSKEDCCYWRYENVTAIYSTNWVAPSKDAEFSYVSPFMRPNDIVSIVGSMLDDILNQIFVIDDFYTDETYYIDLLKKDFKGSGCKFYGNGSDGEVL